MHVVSRRYLFKGHLRFNLAKLSADPSYARSAIKQLGFRLNAALEETIYLHGRGKEFST
jgi:hypothetical protein